MADRQKRTINDVDTEPAEEEARPTKRRKARTSINHLGEIRPGTQYHLVGQYGGPESPTYVMQITVDSKVFQGIGPSKKRAKLMAAESALVDLGVIAAVTDPIPDITQEPYCYDDFTADIGDTNSLLYYDFYVAEPSRDEGAGDGGIVGEKAGDENSFESKMIGKNALTILRELHPSAFYHFVATITQDARPKFIMAVNVDGKKFRGSGINKRLAKARAAREALRSLDKMDFGMAEDGMPVYEGDEKIWLDYKAKLEKEAEAKLESIFVDDPIQQLSEYFPEANVTFPDTTERPDIESFFVCQVIVEGTTYVGSGLSKKDAKSDASAVALNDLKEKGILERKDRELEAKRIEREEKKINEKSKKENAERKSSVGGFKTAVAKLNDGFQNLEYRLIAETPLRNTCLIAFTMAISIHGRNYVGVGKNKKMAKMDAAEKALRDLRMWTEEDEEEKVRMKREEEDLDAVEESEMPPPPGQGQPGRGWGQWDLGGGGGGWGDGGGGGGGNWNGKNNQYGGGYDAGGWGYGGNGGYGQDMGLQQGGGGDGWGQMDPNGAGYQPIMQELNMIMGNMFESTFGQNPWKVGSESVGQQQHHGGGWGFPGGGPGQGAFESRGDFSNRGNIGGSGPQFGGTPTGTNLSETPSSAMTKPSFTPSVNNVAPSGSDGTAINSEPYYGQAYRGRGNFTGGTSSRGSLESTTAALPKYSNFRSAGFDAGFKPSTPVQPTNPSNTETPVPTYGPYGTPVAPPPQVGTGQSGANFPKPGFPAGNVVSGYDAGAGNQMTGNAVTANSTTVAFQGSGGFPTGGNGSTPQQGGYQSGTTSGGFQPGGPNNSGMGQQQYQDFMYQMSGNSGDFPPSGNFQTNITPTSGYSSSGYSSQNYSTASTGYQSSSLQSNYSTQANAYGNQSAASGVQSTGYQGTQSGYSMGNYPAGNTTTSSYTGEGFQGTTADGAYPAESNAGYYGMYSSEYNQGYNYGTNSGYDMNSGYPMGAGYQNTNTNSQYSYGYSSGTGSGGAAADSYSTATNKTTW